MVVGIEKITDMVGPGMDQAIAETLDTDYEGMLGVTPTALAAILMQRYLHEYKLDHDGFRGSSVGSFCPCGWQSECHVPQGHQPRRL